MAITLTPLYLLLLGDVLFYIGKAASEGSHERKDVISVTLWLSGILLILISAIMQGCLVWQAL